MSSLTGATNPFNDNKIYSDHCIRLRNGMQSLPISRHLQGILETIRQHKVIILESETGSGKSTVLPDALMDELQPGQIIALTQNRRIACTLVSEVTIASTAVM